MLLIASWLLLHYLDDFITFLPPSVDLTTYENYFNFLYKTLGMSNNEKKKKRGQVVIFLEIELDFLFMKVRLPVDKLHKAKLCVARMLSHNVIKYDNLQSLIGFLSFATKVVWSSYAFLHCFFDALANSWCHIRLCLQIKADLQLFNYFLLQWNGILLLKDSAKKSLIQMLTDASGNFRMEGYYLLFDKLLSLNQAYSQRFLSRLEPKHINVKQTQEVFFLFWRWLYILAGKYILLYKDNFALFQRLKHLLIKGPGMISMRSITILMALPELTISSV